MSVDAGERASVPFNGRLSKSDYLRAMRLNLRPRTSAILAYAIFLAIMLVGCAVKIAQGEAITYLPGMLMVLLFPVMYFLLPLKIANDNWNTHKLIREPYEGEASPAGVRIKSAVGEATLPWDSYFASRMTPSIVILYQSKTIVHMLPRTLFASDADWEGFRALVRAHAPGAPRGRNRTLLLVIAIVAIAVILIAVRVFTAPRP